MKSKVVTVLSVLGVVSAGAAAGAVNTQALQHKAEGTIGDATALLATAPRHLPTPEVTITRTASPVAGTHKETPRLGTHPVPSVTQEATAAPIVRQSVSPRHKSVQPRVSVSAPEHPVATKTQHSQSRNSAKTVSGSSAALVPTHHLAPSASPTREPVPAVSPSETPIPVDTPSRTPVPVVTHPSGNSHGSSGASSAVPSRGDGESGYNGDDERDDDSRDYEYEGADD